MHTPAHHELVSHTGSSGECVNNDHAAIVRRIRYAKLLRVLEQFVCRYARNIFTGFQMCVCVCVRARARAHLYVFTSHTVRPHMSNGALDLCVLYMVYVYACACKFALIRFA